MKRLIRKVRHWKQQYDKNAAFIFRRQLAYDDKTYEPGDEIPVALFENKTKLRRFWESKFIELWHFEEVDVATGQKPEDIVPTSTDSDDTDAEGIPEGYGFAQKSQLVLHY